MEFSYLPINTENIESFPDRFLITINGYILLFEISWNSMESIFIFDLMDSSESPIIQGKRVVYGSNMFGGCIDRRIPPGVSIIPLDKSGLNTEITLSNFMDSVKPYIVGVV